MVGTEVVGTAAAAGMVAGTADKGLASVAAFRKRVVASHTVEVPADTAAWVAVVLLHTD